MSRVKELAEAEAARAEAEQPEQEPEQEPTQEPEPAEPGEAEPEPEQPEQPQASAPFDVEAFEKEARRHERAIAKVLGPEFVEAVCPTCQGVGYAPQGADAAPQLQTHQDYRACETCAGFGDVLTGSHKQGHELASCPSCAGTGYLMRRPEPEQPANGNAAPGHAPADYGPQPWLGDPTIRPAGQPAGFVSPGPQLAPVR